MSPAVRLVVIAAPALVYLAGITNALTTWDDPLYLTHNARIAAGSFAALWSPSAALDGSFIEFFPLRDSVYWLLHAAFGFAPAPFHAASLAFHVLAAILAALVVRAVGFDERVSTLAGALFAAHPIHVEAVQWAASLKDPMFTCFLFASLLAYAKFRSSSSSSWFVASLLFMVASLLCKSFAIVEPALIAAFELAQADRRSLPRIALRTLPFAVVALAFTALFVEVAHANHVVRAQLDRVSLLSASSWCMVRYLELLALPVRMRVAYAAHPLDAARALVVAVVALAFVAALVLAWKRDKRVWFFLVFYAALLVPVSNLVPFAAIMADRYLYAPSLAFCAIAAFALLSLDAKIARIAIAGVVVVYLFASFVRVRAWADERTLWLEVTDDEPDLASAWAKLGDADAAHGDFTAAAAHELRAASLADDPRDQVAIAERTRAVEHLLSAGRAVDAQGVAADLAKLAQKDWTLRFDLALTDVAAHDLGAAAHDFDAAVALAPDAACARFTAWRDGYAKSHEAEVAAVVAASTRAAGCRRQE